MDQLDRLQDLVGLVYDGALDQAAWPIFLHKLADAVGGAALSLTLRLPRGDDLGLLIGHDIDPAYNESYRRYFYHHDIYVERWQRLPVGSFGTQAMLGLDANAVARSEIFNDWMRPQGFVEAPTLAAVLARDDAGPSSGLGVLRPRGARVYGDDEVALLGALVPHLRRAVAMQAQLGAATAARAALEAALEHAPGAMVLLDRQGRVLLANRRAAALLATDDGCAVRDGQLVAAHPDDTAALHAAIAAALHTRAAAGAPDSVSPTALRRPSQRRPLLALATALGDRARADWHADAAVAVFLTDPDATPMAADHALRDTYNLTPAQARLATLLAGGASLEEAGMTLGITIHTVRAHLKQVFAKTGTRRQAALVRLVLTGSRGPITRPD